MTRRKGKPAAPTVPHFVGGDDVDWEATARLPSRRDGRFPGVVERGEEMKDPDISQKANEFSASRKKETTP